MACPSGVVLSTIELTMFSGRHQGPERPGFGGVPAGRVRHARGPAEPAVRAEGEGRATADRPLRVRAEDDRQRTAAERVRRRPAGVADGRLRPVRRNGPVADGPPRRVHVPAASPVRRAPAEAVRAALRRPASRWVYPGDGRESVAGVSQPFSRYGHNMRNFRRASVFFARFSLTNDSKKINKQISVVTRTTGRETLFRGMDPIRQVQDTRLTNIINI